MLVAPPIAATGVLHVPPFIKSRDKTNVKQNKEGKGQGKQKY